MSTPLRDLMTERADRLAPPVVDTAALMETGRRRVRRRRFAGVAGVAVLGVVAALVVPGQLGGSDEPGLVAVTPTSSQAPIAWARGSVLHTSPDGPEVELGEQPLALVQGDSGFVFSDSAGTVRAVLDGEVVEVGRLQAADAARFESDGDVVAWVDAGDGEPAYAALDLSRGPGVVSLPVTQGFATPLEGERGMNAAVAAVDGGTVYLRARNGAGAWQPFAADDEVVPLPVADGTRVVLEDVKDGVFHYRRASGTPADKEEAYIVGPDLRTGVTLDSWDGALSPDGRYLVSETEDENRVSDTTTGELLPFDPGPYAFVAAYRWLDGDTYAALAMKDTRVEELDLLRCEVGTGRCEPVVTDQAMARTPLVLPQGVSW